MDKVWDCGFAECYRRYAPEARSYTKLGKADCARIAADLASLLEARSVPGAITSAATKFPQRTGAMKIVPRF